MKFKILINKTFTVLHSPIQCPKSNTKKIKKKIYLIIKIAPNKLYKLSTTFQHDKKFYDEVKYWSSVDLSYIEKKNILSPITQKKKNYYCYALIAYDYVLYLYVLLFLLLLLLFVTCSVICNNIFVLLQYKFLHCKLLVSLILLCYELLYIINNTLKTVWSRF